VIFTCGWKGAGKMKTKLIMIIMAAILSGTLILEAKDKENKNSKKDTISATQKESENRDFVIEIYKTEVINETSVSGKFIMNVNCTGILKKFKILEGSYSAVPIGQVEALLKSDVAGYAKGEKLRIVSTALVNMRSGSYAVQEIVVTLTRKNGKVLESKDVDIDGGFDPFDVTFQSLEATATGSF
jgi:hypothetical protein